MSWLSSQNNIRHGSLWSSLCSSEGSRSQIKPIYLHYNLVKVLLGFFFLNSIYWFTLICYIFVRVCRGGGSKVGEKKCSLRLPDIYNIMNILFWPPYVLLHVTSQFWCKCFLYIISFLKILILWTNFNYNNNTIEITFNFG